MLPSGKPLRLYPIPYRYLGGEKEFSLYQWITAGIQKKQDDSRPESFRIDCDSIEVGDVIHPTQDECFPPPALLRATTYRHATLDIMVRSRIRNTLWHMAAAYFHEMEWMLAINTATPVKH
jgi:hypothetical protein